MAEPDRSGQQQYWDRNLDPDNLSRQPRRKLEGPAEFYFTPDQEAALAALNVHSGNRILEVGIGLGKNAVRLSQLGVTVVGIDISAQRLQSLARDLKANGKANVLLVQCAAENLPFRNEAFNGLYSKSVLIHTRIEEAASELSRVLQTDGRFAFVEPMTGNPFVNLYRNTLAPREWQSITVYFDQWRISQLTRPFGEVHLQYFYITAFLAFVWQFAIRLPRIFCLFLQPLHKFDQWLLHRRPALCRYAWFVVMSGRK